jgi:diketogulonate reductase-like aldo/keto reductase
VGEGIKEAIAKSDGKIKREDLFVATKIRHSQYDDPEGALRESLKKLGLDYVDLYFIHWPAGYFSPSKKPLHELWAQLEALVDKGLVKSLGVSNFNVQLLCDLLCYARHKPVCN